MSENPHTLKWVMAVSRSSIAQGHAQKDESRGTTAHEFRQSTQLVTPGEGRGHFVVPGWERLRKSALCPAFYIPSTSYEAPVPENEVFAAYSAAIRICSWRGTHMQINFYIRIEDPSKTTCQGPHGQRSGVDTCYFGWAHKEN